MKSILAPFLEEMKDARYYKLELNARAVQALKEETGHTAVALAQSSILLRDYIIDRVSEGGPNLEPDDVEITFSTNDPKSMLRQGFEAVIKVRYPSSGYIANAEHDCEAFVMDEALEGIVPRGPGVEIHAEFDWLR